jgi:hypothetical protein
VTRRPAKKPPTMQPTIIKALGSMKGSVASMAIARRMNSGMNPILSRLAMIPSPVPCSTKREAARPTNRELIRKLRPSNSPTFVMEGGPPNPSGIHLFNVQSLNFRCPASQPSQAFAWRWHDTFLFTELSLWGSPGSSEPFRNRGIAGDSRGLSGYRLCNSSVLKVLPSLRRLTIGQVVV